MKPIKVLQVGAGNMGRYHIQNLVSLEAFDLVAVVDPVLDSPWEEIPTFKSLDQALASVSFSAAVVASPTETHYQLVSKLLKAGKHVLVEKPAAATAIDAEALFSLARENGLKLAVGNIERCNPAVDFFGKLISSEVFGKPLHIRCERAGTYPNSVQPGNDVILDLAVHEIDTVARFFGPPAITACQVSRIKYPDIVDIVDVQFKCPDNLPGSLHADWLTPQKRRQLTLTMERASVELDYLKQSCLVYGRDIAKLWPSELLGPMKIEAPFENVEKLIPRIDYKHPLELELVQWAKYLNDGTHALCTDELLYQEVAWAAQMKEIGLSGNVIPGSGTDAADPLGQSRLRH